MVKVYGYSDDVVVIKGSKYEFEEIGACDSDVIIRFTDGTVIRVEYDGCWSVYVETRGTAHFVNGLDFSKGYTDVFQIDAEVKSHEVVDRRWWV